MDKVYVELTDDYYGNRKTVKDSKKHNFFSSRGRGRDTKSTISLIISIISLILLLIVLYFVINLRKTIIDISSQLPKSKDKNKEALKKGKNGEKPKENEVMDLNGQNDLSKRTNTSEINNIVCIFEIKDNSKETLLFNPDYLNLTPEEYNVSIDGILVNSVNKYKFDCTGRHIVIFTFKKLLTSLKSIFKNIINLVEIDLSNLKSNAVANTKEMFMECRNLRNINLKGFNTSLVTDMSYMFEGLQYIEELDLSEFDTSKVRDMSHMFSEMGKITSLDLRNFVTSQVTDMSYMFFETYSLKEIDITNFYISDSVNLCNLFGYEQLTKKEKMAIYYNSNKKQDRFMKLIPANIQILDVGKVNQN